MDSIHEAYEFTANGNLFKSPIPVEVRELDTCVIARFNHVGKWLIIWSTAIIDDRIYFAIMNGNSALPLPDQSRADNYLYQTTIN